MQIDLNLIKEIRETADWLLAFPEKLIWTVMSPQLELLKRRERIRRLKEIVELREIGKAIQELYFSKGSLVHWLEELQSTARTADCELVRELFNEVKIGIDRIKVAVAETYVSNTTLGADAALFLSRASLAYEKLSELPDETLLNDKAVVAMATLLQEIIESGSVLIKRLDEHRASLDHMYSD